MHVYFDFFSIQKIQREKNQKKLFQLLFFFIYFISPYSIYQLISIQLLSHKWNIYMCVIHCYYLCDYNHLREWESKELCHLCQLTHSWYREKNRKCRHCWTTIFKHKLIRCCIFILLSHFFKLNSTNLLFIQFSNIPRK